MAKKFYAIKEGFDFEKNCKVENIIVNTWTECLKYVKGVKGAKYKSFDNIDDANIFLNQKNKLLKKSEFNYPKDCLHIYVDGSYNVKSKMYSYAVIGVKNNVIQYIECDSGFNASENNIRQIAGELQATVKGLQYAISIKEKKVVIFHDYEGIYYHAKGIWERKEKSSQQYYNTMNKLMSSGIEVIFVKVDSHTGDFFNELADEKCKQKIKLKSDKVVARWLSKNILRVKNKKLKKEILEIAPNCEKNIIIVNDDIYNNNFNQATNLFSGDDKVNSNRIQKLTSLAQTKFLSLYDAEYKNKKGNLKHWTIASRKSLDELKSKYFQRKEEKVDAVIIAALHLEDNKLVCIKQFRVPLDDYVYELPAGLVDKEDKSIEDTTRRELKEETGFTLEKINYEKTNRKLYASAGMTDESAALVYCTCKGYISKEYLEEDEDIEVVLLSQQEAKELLKKDVKMDIRVFIILQAFAQFGSKAIL